LESENTEGKKITPYRSTKYLQFKITPLFLRHDFKHAYTSSPYLPYQVSQMCIVFYNIVKKAYGS